MASSKFDLLGAILNNAFFFIFIILIFRVIAKSQKRKTGRPGSGLEKIISLLVGKQTNKNDSQETTTTIPKDQTPRVPNLIKNIWLNNIPLLAAPTPVKLDRRQRYLQVALNSTLDEARVIISQLPRSVRILVEAGTPLIKKYGVEAIQAVKTAAWPGAYIVADSKTADLAEREVEQAVQAGANAITCLGVAPVETIDRFIDACEKLGIDSMIDMMNVERAHLVLKKLKKLPRAVVLHRGVDETEFSKEKQIPYYQIKQIRGGFNILVSVAGGDTIREIQRSVFNDANIVVVWKNFYRSSSDTAALADQFLKEIK